MKILALDTSGQQAGAAIVDKYITLGEIMINAQSGPKTWHHSEILMPAVERLFALSGQELGCMDYVAYTAGPGSFTGLRIGAATALGLARSINKPAVAVPTLDSLAYNVLCMIPFGGVSGVCICPGKPSGQTQATCLIVPLMDARRGQVYTAIYRAGQSGELTRITDYFAAPVNEVLERVGELNAPAFFLGDGADVYKSEIVTGCPSASFAPANANRQRPASVGLCAMHQVAAGIPVSQPELIYIRDPQAVRNNPQLKTATQTVKL